MKSALVLVAFVCQCVFCAGAVAQIRPADDPAEPDTLDIRLQQAISLALERNPTVALERLSPGIAKTYSRAEAAEFHPQLNFEASKSRNKAERFLGSQPEPFELTTDREAYGLSLTEKLPTGTSISANASVSGSISSIYTDQYVGQVGMTITQSLLKGLGPGPNMANLRKANIDVEISRLELKAFAEQIVAEVERGYWDLFLAKREMQIQERSLELAERQLNESKERIAVGRLAELELASVQAEVATRKEAQIDAQSRYEQARLHFLFLLNPTDAEQWDLVPVTLDEPFSPEDTLDVVQVHVELADEFRPDLGQARLDLEKNRLDVVRTKNGLLPLLDLFVSFGRTSYAQSFGESLPDLGSPFYDVSAGLTFEMPLFNGQARAEHARSKYTREQLELALSNMSRMVQRDVRAAYVEVLRSREQINATKVARELQEQKESAELEKYRVGKSTNYLVLQAQRDLTESHLNEARAMVAYLTALVDLYLMEGTLLERRGIQSPDIDG